MGTLSSVHCRRCNTDFVVACGGGMVADTLHCTKCGHERSVAHAELGDIWTEHLANRGREADRRYRAAVTEHVGPCECGGRFTHGASPRCPQCRSTKAWWDTTSIGLFD